MFEEEIIQNKSINLLNTGLSNIGGSIKLLNEVVANFENLKSEISSMREFIPQEKIEVKVSDNSKTFILGINNLQKKNDEALFDAISFFDKKCPYCNSELYKTTIREKIEFDHFIPISKGGQDVPWNLLPVCRNCNRKKSDKLPIIFLKNDTFTKCNNYLLAVKDKFQQNMIQSYEDTYKIIQLIDENKSFITKHKNEKFIIELISVIYPEFVEELFNSNTDNSKGISDLSDSLSISSEKFIDECIGPALSNRCPFISMALIYNKYKNWCKDNKLSIVSTISLGKSLKNKGYISARGKKGERGYINLFFK